MLKDTHPEGHDFCGNAGIKAKIPFLNLWQPDAPSEDPLNLLSQNQIVSFNHLNLSAPLWQCQSVLA